jgi:hypothetical protein
LDFKDRAACTHSRLLLPFRLPAGSPSTSGALLLFNSVELVNFDFVPLSASSSLKNPPSGFVLPLRGGARLLPLCRAPCQPVSSVRILFSGEPLPFFRLTGARLLPLRRVRRQLQPVTYSSCQFPRVTSGRSCLPVRGTRLLPAPRWMSTDFVDLRISAPPRCFERGGRITTASAPSRQILRDQVLNAAMLSTASIGVNPPRPCDASPPFS